MGRDEGRGLGGRAHRREGRDTRREAPLCCGSDPYCPVVLVVLLLLPLRILLALPPALLFLALVTGVAQRPPRVAGHLLGVRPLEARLPQRHRVVPPRVQRHAKSHLPTDAGAQAEAQGKA